jgi:hypothetical protein
VQSCDEALHDGSRQQFQVLDPGQNERIDEPGYRLGWCDSAHTFLCV